MLTTMHIGDVHLSDQAPGYRSDSYRTDILDKLAWCMTEANRRKVEAVLIAGDVFHRKRGVPYDLVIDALDVLNLYDGPKIILPGNHDVVDNYMAGVSKRPIGLLARFPNISLALEPFVLKNTLQVFPVPYRRNIGYGDVLTPAVAGGLYRLLWIHYGVTPEALPYETLVTSDPRFVCGADALFAGHVHDNHGAWKAQDGTPCFNLGSLSRGSLTTDNLTRPVRVLISTWPDPSATLEVPEHKALKVQARPADEVFRLADAEERKEAETVAATFIAELGDTTLRAISPEEIREGIDKLVEVPERVRAKAALAVEEVFDA